MYSKIILIELSINFANSIIFSYYLNLETNANVEKIISRKIICPCIAKMINNNHQSILERCDQ